jgi:hypothetical protein
VTTAALSRADARWEAAVDEHRIAVAAFLDAAERVPSAAWTVARAPGKWTPAQLCEHLSLSYDALLTELAEGRPMAPRATGWKRAVLRTLVLPHILFHGSIPVRAPAPRETRPPEACPDRRAALARLREVAERFEHRLDAARRVGGGRVTHPYFGPLPPDKAMRFCAVHLDHHRPQLGARK